MSEQRLRRAYDWLFHMRAAAGRPHCLRVDQLQALAEGRAARDLQIKLLDHVMSCNDCHGEFELLRSLYAAHGRLTTRDHDRL